MNIGPPSNQTFQQQIYTYYNQYCASPALTQRRRIMRNYLSNNEVIKQYNTNPYTANPNVKYYFLDGKMYIQKGNILSRYIRTGSVWCYNKEIILSDGETATDYFCRILKNGSW